jgi:hypothetical protein
VIKLRLKSFVFFDTDAVTRRVPEGRRKALAKAGGWLRSTARRSMRKGRLTKDGKRKPSEPGQPPKTWSGQLKNLLFFGYDLSTDSVVVGPEKFGDGKAPAVHEYGGTLVVSARYARRKRSNSQAKVRVKYKPRPTMGPALQKGLDHNIIPEAFRDTISK